MPASAPSTVGVSFEQGTTDVLEFSESVGVTVNDVPPNWPTPEDAPAYRLGNLLSLPSAGKWRGHAFAGMVVPRPVLLKPGVELRRLLNLQAIFPATIAELTEYERQYGESREIVEKREGQLGGLRRSLNKRARAVRSDSARAGLFAELVREWSDIENQCRMRWTGEFGGLIGKTEEQIRRYWLDRESDLRTLGEKEDHYREQMTVVAEPLLIAAAGLSVDIAPLHDFLASTAHQWNGRNPKEWEVLDWLPKLRYKLLHQEQQSKPWYKRASSFAIENGVKIVVGIVVGVAVTLVVAFAIAYFRSRGINLK